MEIQLRATEVAEVATLARLWRFLTTNHDRKASSHSTIDNLIDGIDARKASFCSMIDNLLNSINFENKYAKVQDADTAAIYKVLKEHFPDISDDPSQTVYRYNPAVIRIQVVSEKLKYIKGGAFLRIERLLETVPDGHAADVLGIWGYTPKQYERQKKDRNIFIRAFEDCSCP
jgi:hypothetical protein